MTDTKEYYRNTKNGAISVRRRGKRFREEVTFEIGLF